jgi:hypothetical protein
MPGRVAASPAAKTAAIVALPCLLIVPTFFMAPLTRLRKEQY